MVTAPPTLTPPPAVPDLANRTTFPGLAQAWTQWQKISSYPELQTMLANVYANALDCYTNALTASAAALTAQSTGIKWVSGTTYAEGDVRWSPANYQTYRRKSAGAGATDPSADTTNWAAINDFVLTIVTGTSHSASAGQDLVLTNAALTTVTLPATPVSGNRIRVTVCNGLLTNVVARNGSYLNCGPTGTPLAEDMTLINPMKSYLFVYINATYGWRLM